MPHNQKKKEKGKRKNEGKNLSVAFGGLNRGRVAASGVPGQRQRDPPRSCACRLCRAGWRRWGKQPAWGWTGQRLGACLCASVCVVCVRVVHWMRVPVFTGAGETSAPRSAGAASGARQGEILETRHSEGEPHMHTRTHTHTYTHSQKRATHCIAEILNTGAESKSWSGSLFAGRRKEKHSAPKTSSSPQTQLVLDPKLQIAF